MTDEQLRELRQRNATPPEFKALLLQLARSARPNFKHPH